MADIVSFQCQGATRETDGGWFVEGECLAGPISTGGGFQRATDVEGAELEVALVVSAVVLDDGSDSDHLVTGATGRLRITGHEPSMEIAGMLLTGSPAPVG